MTCQALGLPTLLCLLVTLLSAALPAGAEGTAAAPPHPPAAPPRDPGALGVGVQRTMTLLATSTPARRNKVRILFYGQSITEQEWSRTVADDLRKRFPNADLEIENRAIGGFASQLLIRPAEHDLYPFYPDLLIFHVYGANQQYEEIIRSVRSRTTAEVLMQKDHVTAWPPAVPDEKADKGLWWDHQMNQVYLPEIARKYGCGLVDVRAPWLDYLKANHLEPKALLSDDVHLNPWGNDLLAQLVSRYLVYRPDLPKDAWQDLVRTYEVGKDVRWRRGRLALEFEGNRVDLVSSWTAEGKPTAARVLIDGRKPSEFPGTYRITRPSPGPWSPLFLSRVDHEAPLVVEDWTLKVTSVKPEAKQFAYEVSGSVTGPDGAGDNGRVFTSKSGRVKIDPEAFFIPGPLPQAGYEVKWQVLPMHADAYEAPRVTDPSREAVVTVAQGLPNGPHRLELAAEGGPEAPVRALRVYRPPLR